MSMLSIRIFRNQRNIGFVDGTSVLRYDELLCNRSRKGSKEPAKKKFARRRFETESKNGNLPGEVGKLAARAAKTGLV